MQEFLAFSVLRDLQGSVSLEGKQIFFFELEECKSEHEHDCLEGWGRGINFMSDLNLTTQSWWPATWWALWKVWKGKLERKGERLPHCSFTESKMGASVVGHGSMAKKHSPSVGHQLSSSWLFSRVEFHPHSQKGLPQGKDTNTDSYLFMRAKSQMSLWLTHRESNSRSHAKSAFVWGITSLLGLNTLRENKETLLWDFYHPEVEEKTMMTLKDGTYLFFFPRAWI